MRFEDCRSEAWARLTERPPPYLESAYNNRKVSEARLPYCGYLEEVESSCLPLLSPSCYSPHQLSQVWAGWLRQEVGPSLRLLPRDQYFQCNTTTALLSGQELGAMREMISQRDWLANSRFCPYLLTYSVQPSPNYWLHSMLRCDGLCDPNNKLEIPFRVSPTINNPPR